MRNRGRGRIETAAAGSSANVGSEWSRLLGGISKRRAPIFTSGRYIRVDVTPRRSAARDRRSNGMWITVRDYECRRERRGGQSSTGGFGSKPRVGARDGGSPGIFVQA